MNPLPCPFCGHHPEVDRGETGATIECVEPACWQPSLFCDHEDHGDGYGLAVAQWNARSPQGFPAAIFEDHKPAAGEPKSFSGDPVEPEDILSAKEIGEFQDDARGILVKAVNDAGGHGDRIDGGGCDSGYWPDFTLSEIGQGVGMLEEIISDQKQRAEKYETRVAELVAAIARGGLDLCPCRICSRIVACIPDGLTFCEECAQREAQRS